MESTEKRGRGRPPGRKFPKQCFTVVTSEVHEELKRAAEEDGVSESSILRDALTEYLVRRLEQKAQG